MLRLRAGAAVVFFDGRGREYEAVLEDMSAPAVRARVLQQREGIPEPRTRLVLYQSLIKGDRFDWVLEKGTELGVAAFVPLISHRSVMRPRGGDAGKSARWRRIIVEAAEQCGRSVLPELAPVTDLGEAFDSAPGLRLLPWEEERALALRTVLREALSEGAKLAEVSLFIGPEGGFTGEEVERARAGGVQSRVAGESHPALGDGGDRRCGRRCSGSSASWAPRALSPPASREPGRRARRERSISQCRCGPVAMPGAAHVTHEVAFVHHLPHLDGERREVAISAEHAVAVIDEDAIAVVGPCSTIRHPSAVRCHDRHAFVGRQIDAAVEAAHRSPVVAATDAVGADDTPVERAR